MYNCQESITPFRRRVSQWPVVATIFVALLGVASSCGSSKGVTASRHHTASVSYNNIGGKPSALTPVAPLPIPSSLAPSSKKLLEQAYGWLGTPYAYGGETRSGVDCSGLVMNVYRDALAIKLPRSSAKQQEFCQPLDPSAIAEGDLIFFAPSGRNINHVGIYVGSGYMIHASNSGVALMAIDSPWAKSRFHSVGRVSSYWAAVERETKNLRDASERRAPVLADNTRKSKPQNKPDNKTTTGPAKTLKTIPAPAIATLASDSIAFDAFFE